MPKESCVACMNRPSLCLRIKSQFSQGGLLPSKLICRLRVLNPQPWTMRFLESLKGVEEEKYLWGRKDPASSLKYGNLNCKSIQLNYCYFN